MDYDSWVEALRRGESYVSDGTAHLLDFQRNPDGSFTVQAAARKPGEPDVEVELIANGLPISTQSIKANGKLSKVIFAPPAFSESAWVAVRIFPSAHSNPIWVKVNDKPVRVKSSIAWCAASLEQCWREKQRKSVPPQSSGPPNFQLATNANALARRLLVDIYVTANAQA